MTTLPKANDLKTLENSWDVTGFYRDPATEMAASTGIQQHLLVYHLYVALLGTTERCHAVRALALAEHLSAAVSEIGLLKEPDGTVNDHPAAACHVADAERTASASLSRQNMARKTLR